MFFPLMKTEGLTGFLDLTYLPPNNWENRINVPLNLYAIWPEGGSWTTENLGLIQFGESHSFDSSQHEEKLVSGMCLIYPSAEKLDSQIDKLPEKPVWDSRIPEWRATTGFKNAVSQTSYQGEIFPLPSKASLLTFHPFIQYGEVENRLLVLNVTKNPEIIESDLFLYDSKSKSKRGSSRVKTNSLTTIQLDGFNFAPHELPAFLIPNMAGIPFGLGVSKDGSMLSMEHTHPPASLVLFGNRFAVQGSIKKKWFVSLLGESK
ncbi:hypothetical protein A1s21155_06290 [Candidatus Planktophila dulcis]|uniref:Uncharacterized protein n=2 Tax=Candidatus Planktophila dulcis TaxID=1884914 RepID=A0AAC9YV56_9ACTN|nr:hypothetical protein A1s21155_06290 [Candidatus Planktophila dulcis]